MSPNEHQSAREEKTNVDNFIKMSRTSLDMVWQKPVAGTKIVAVVKYNQRRYLSGRRVNVLSLSSSKLLAVIVKTCTMHGLALYNSIITPTHFP